MRIRHHELEYYFFVTRSRANYRSIDRELRASVRAPSTEESLKHEKKESRTDDMKPFGNQKSNPWEVMYKIFNGQLGEEMPALRAFDHQIITDITCYMTTLPKE